MLRERGQGVARGAKERHGEPWPVVKNPLSEFDKRMRRPNKSGQTAASRVERGAGRHPMELIAVNRPIRTPRPRALLIIDHSITLAEIVLFARRQPRAVQLECSNSQRLPIRTATDTNGRSDMIRITGCRASQSREEVSSTPRSREAYNGKHFSKVQDGDKSGSVSFVDHSNMDLERFEPWQRLLACSWLTCSKLPTLQVTSKYNEPLN